MKSAFFNCLSLVYKYAVTKIKGIRIIPNFENGCTLKALHKYGLPLHLKTALRSQSFSN